MPLSRVLRVKALVTGCIHISNQGNARPGGDRRYLYDEPPTSYMRDYSLQWTNSSSNSLIQKDFWCKVGPESG